MSTHQPSPGPSTQPLPARQKQKQHTVGIGIAAGAEDAKYQAKYKDLKRKVKEIETENDKLHFRVLQAKRSIQRMKLERAILYERLSGTPNASEAAERHALPPNHTGPTVYDRHPPSRSHSGAYVHQETRDHHPRVDSDRLPPHYPPHDRPRMVSGHDARGVGPLGSGVAPSPHMSGMQSPPRHHPNEVYETSHHLQHMPPLPPVPQLDGSRSHGHSRPPTIHHSHSSSSHHRARSPSSHSRSRHSSEQAYPPSHPHHSETMSSGQHVMHGSPVMERERSRRHDVHEYPSIHRDPHGNGRHSGYPSHHSPPLHPSETRSSSRIHNHQRMGPGTYVNKDEHYDHPRDLERGRDWEREREREIHERERSRDFGRSRDISGSHILSPQSVPRPRQPVDRDYPEHHMSTRAREEQMYYRDPPSAPGSYPIHSRSGTPGSGSGSGIGVGEGPPPDARGHYYDHDRNRSYKLRPVVQPNEDIDFVHEDGRSGRDRGGGGGGYALQEQNRSSMESRKRGRNDMDIDSDDGEDGPVHPSGRLIEDRSSKRYHREAASESR